MKAYKCDICENVFDGYPAGVIYNNTVKDRYNRRTDLCAYCLKETLDHGLPEITKDIISEEQDEDTE